MHFGRIFAAVFCGLGRFGLNAGVFHAECRFRLLIRDFIPRFYNKNRARMELCFVRETSGSRFFFVFYTRGVGVYCALRSHFCGRFVLPVSFLGTRGVGGDHLSRFVVLALREDELSRIVPRLCQHKRRAPARYG